MITSKKLRFIVIAILLFCIHNYINAADEQKWYEDRDEAFAIAKEQNKYVFLLHGRTGCGNCKAAKKFISEPPLNQMVEESFILWFCDYDILEKREQAREYIEYFNTNITFPLLCPINPYKPLPALAYHFGYRTAEQIETILTNNLPTANEDITVQQSYAYISDNILTISNEIAKETIQIYTITGQLIDSFDKIDNTTIRNASFYPKGVLLINSTQGWSMKIINWNF